MRLLLFLFSLSFLGSCTKKLNSSVDSSCINQNADHITRDCSYDYDPVCGCNQSTYPNACFAEAAGVKQWKKGICEGMCIDPSFIIKEKICYRESAPVCGCDGNTYSNPCIARKNGILSFTDGECGTSDLK